MPKRTRVTEKKFKEALDGSAGIYSVIAKRIGVNRRTVYSFVERMNFQYLINEEREKLVDKAEVQLIKKVDEGDWRAIERVLSTLGRDRGYGDKIEIEQRSYTFSIELKKMEINPTTLEEDGRKAEDSVVTNTETVGSLPDTTGQDNN